MHIVDIIAKKRDGIELSQSEIDWLIKSYTSDAIPDYQMAAWLMAVFFRGMSDTETAALTMAMAASGDMVDLSQVPGVKVDKHSTGGVGDTTTLVLAPTVAAAGVPVAKMSGRGLGFTGGTIDKLEAIPGFKVALECNEFIANLQRHNMAITGQTASVAPADGKLYSLRDVTATVESIPLIASSIMSKKIASGADKIILDVKVGNGAFMKSREDAIKLAETMVRIGQLVDRETVAILTSMEQPLGMAIGNSLEIKEAIEILQGRGEPLLKEVCLTIGSYMLTLGGKAQNYEDGRRQFTALLDTRQALAKFGEFIEAQGGDSSILQDTTKLPQAQFIQEVYSGRSGYVAAIKAAQIGYAAMRLGAGREYKGQTIDLSAGIVMQCRVGQAVQKGQALAVIYTNDKSKITEVDFLIRQAILFADKPVPSPPLILGIVDKYGFHR
ncbi:pyrimidine-nucleoside phosphorylase [Sporomusa acidovorans]|uniref:Pyrimidine-nucleoside phosphorylase n=1 Tax=Sporomusa acidovorans (strain ATCC 49682 / DSM 3132 / Mol) TaxID=1123286 RepID=A0ABZ3J397_SPOA4|nr:pyrimidine-nucleoside phosphorylase [Sporomusa acidovorans]OZC20343.1 pyrimidine-nucleoside phosphorylase [Sporomusa acidovorans DSM 3132]SDD37022.1 pyrimidine-nucleoside phosphorylase [Sporomusa acidovorans]